MKFLFYNFLFCLFHFSGHSPATVYHGVVGGNVTFYCPVAQKSPLQFLYFQKVVAGEPIFCNGYHSSKRLPTPIPNTEMDQNYTMMHINGLNLSDSGDYYCYYMHKDAASGYPIKIHMYLNVTGRQVFNINVCLTVAYFM